MLNKKESGWVKGDGVAPKSFTMKSEEEYVSRYIKAYMGVLKDSVLASSLKKLFLQEGIFIIRVTILGPNLCLLEDLVHGEVEIFIEERRE